MIRSRLAESIRRASSANLHRPGSVAASTAERVARATLHGYLKREVIVPWTIHVPVTLYQRAFEAIEDRQRARKTTHERDPH